jgi:hypothetical protein
MVDGCIRFYDVEMGNTCYGIALHAGISLSDFYAWNPAVGTDCSNLQAGTFVCIGKSGYATTITSGTPEPVTPTPTQMSSLFLSLVEVVSQANSHIDRLGWSRVALASMMSTREMGVGRLLLKRGFR